jgi:hypothetical protein
MHAADMSFPLCSIPAKVHQYNLQIQLPSVSVPTNCTHCCMHRKHTDRNLWAVSAILLVPAKSVYFGFVYCGVRSRRKKRQSYRLSQSNVIMHPLGTLLL